MDARSVFGDESSFFPKKRTYYFYTELIFLHFSPTLCIFSTVTYNYFIRLKRHQIFDISFIRISHINESVFYSKLNALGKIYVGLRQTDGGPHVINE